MTLQRKWSDICNVQLSSRRLGFYGTEVQDWRCPMFRRDFLKAAIVASATPASSVQAQPGGATFQARLIRENDRVLGELLKRQERVTTHSWVGGLVDPTGIHTVQGTTRFIGRATAALCSEESDYYGSQELVESVKLATRYLLRVQHPDGTIDLHTTNFHSPPDSAFVVEPLAAAVSLLRDGCGVQESFAGDLETFLRRVGEALTVGGIHTPNHRWVVCAALARLNSLFPDHRYVARIDEWLAEGIDIDADGQYTERSTSIYSATCDRMLITVSRLLDRPSLLEPVRKNLEMTRFLVHPNGEVVTEISRRQDQYRPGSLRRYYLPYLYMAANDQSADFAAVARLIERSVGVSLSGDLPYLLEISELTKPLPSGGVLPDSYLRHFPASGLVRFREGDMSASVVSANSTFLSMHQGNAVLQGVRFASAFFGKGQFRGSLSCEGRKCELIQSLRAPYYQPVRPGTIPYGTWPQGHRKLREQSEVQELTAGVSIVFGEPEIDCTIEIEGTDRVPVAIELSFRKGGTLIGVEAVKDTLDGYLLTSGFGEYRMGADSIQFGPGRTEHTWVQLRGAEPKLDGLSIYLTGFTPFRHTLQFNGRSN